MTIVKDKYRGTKAYASVRERLVVAAQHKEFATYKELANIMGIRPSGSFMAGETGQICGEISEDEHLAGQPMLSCLVVHTGDRKPGEGFFVLAKQLGLLSETADNEERERFWTGQCEAVYEAFK